MAEIDVPFVDSAIDTSDGVGSLMTVAVLVVGFMIFAFARTAGQTLFQQVNSTLGNILGYNATGSSNSNGPGGV